MKFIFIYIIFINLFLFTLLGIDKKRAKLHKWRIREKTLMCLAILGGSLGGILGIYTFKHKTKHLKFTLGYTIILLKQLLSLFYIH